MNPKYIQISENIYFIEGVGGGKYPYSNSVYIKDDDGCLLDSGVGIDILNTLRNKVERVFYTHWHEDHTVFNNLFKKKFINVIDMPAVEDEDEFCSRYPFPRIGCEELIKLFRLQFKKGVFTQFQKEDVFECGDILIGVLHTPGHTAGHSSFVLYDGREAMLFLGDIDLSSFGPWYGGLDSDVNQFIDSITLLKEFIGNNDINTVVTGHKGVFKGKELIINRLHSYLYKIFEREKKIMNFISDGVKLDDLVGKGIIYTEIPEDKIYRYHVERRMLKLHIDRLMKMRFLKMENDLLYKV